ncbi:MAG: reverse transcriptase domain-containing protein [Pirellulaceae bacterium]
MQQLCTCHKWASDLKQFYDRVRPDLLHKTLDGVRRGDDELDFFDFAKSLLDWRWHSRDQKNEVGIYTQQAGLDDFERVSLPQGLVASGFLANIVLLPFDAGLQQAIGTEIEEGILIADTCRYVDDLRVTVALGSDSDMESEAVNEAVCKWLSDLLTEKAAGLELSAEKTKVATFDSDERPLVRQSTRMNRIQTAVSGGFDAIAGEEILDAIQGLMRAQDALSVADESGWRLSPVPDVRDETVARFGAARFRATFRSIRPLLESGEGTSEVDTEPEADAPAGGVRVARTQRELDEDVRAFALGLIQRWVHDPSNVRLLRIGLDLWPHVEVLRDVLELLRPFTERGGRRKAPRRVAWYCLSEILRAGATETGLVADAESLPSGIDLDAYRQALRGEADRLVGLPGATIPWYLRQQALLFLAAFDPSSAPVVRTGTGAETRHYRELIRFLRGEGDRLRSSDFATLAVLARRAFVDRLRAYELTRPALNAARIRQIAERDPSFVLELLGSDTQRSLFDNLPARVREDLALGRSSEEYELLADVIQREHPTGPLRNELGLLRIARAFLQQWQQEETPPAVITPAQVALRREDDAGISSIVELRILGSRVDPSGSLYQSPEWCESAWRWRFQLGFLMRFILSGQRDFTRQVRPVHWKEGQSAYRAAESHWYQRLYGLFSGQQAFGDDWLPISDWMEQFLLALLRWPGCRKPEDFDWIESGLGQTFKGIDARIAELEQLRGRSTGALLVPLIAKRPTAASATRPLRACIVQTAIPAADDFDKSDLTLDGRAIRKKHRNHLSAALAAVERMLALRETHKGSDGRLDWLILPELAVHPSDVRTHLIPFARAHRAMILAGMTYEGLITGQPLINSALWVIPEWSAAHGLQIRTRRQGKGNLAPNEQAFNISSTRLQGFRPCQWLIGYPWSGAHSTRPVWLTAAVCYDATDLALAKDLRDKSDVLTIPALNKDVKTFDQMALALHYHMFQLVVVANNGQYGGSNAYWPVQDAHRRQVFHLHGQPQASIAFLEIDDIADFLDRRNHVKPPSTGSGTGSSRQGWKYPPAGMDGQ